MTGVIVIFKSNMMLKRELSLTCTSMAAPSRPLKVGVGRNGNLNHWVAGEAKERANDLHKLQKKHAE